MKLSCRKKRKFFSRKMSVSLGIAIALVILGHALAFGIRNAQEELRWGIALLGVTLLKLFLHDLANLQALNQHIVDSLTSGLVTTDHQAAC
jgi:uncharacterized membrane protein